MSQLNLTAAGGGGTVSLKGPSTTTGNAAIELTVPGTGSATVDTLGRAGNILQVLQTVKTDTASVTSNNFADLSGMSAPAITTTGSNKVLIRLFVHWGTEAGHAISFRLVKDTGGSVTVRPIKGDTAGSRDSLIFGGLHSNAPWEVNPASMEYLDSPGAGTHTYKLQWAVPSGATIAYFNRSFRDNNQAGEARTPSVITVMEVAA